MLTRNPFVYRLISRARVFLILSGALYPLISCCIFLPKKQTNRKTWSNNNTEQQNLKQDLSGNKLMMIQTTVRRTITLHIKLINCSAKQKSDSDAYYRTHICTVYIKLRRKQRKEKISFLVIRPPSRGMCLECSCVKKLQGGP